MPPALAAATQAAVSEPTAASAPGAPAAWPGRVEVVLAREGRSVPTAAAVGYDLTSRRAGTEIWGGEEEAGVLIEGSIVRDRFFQAFVLLLITAAAGAAVAAPALPNVLFVLIDDMGYADLSCYGERRVHTDHIDRLA